MNSALLRKIASDYETSARLLREAADMQDEFAKRFPGLVRMEMPISEMLLSVRSRNTLARMGIERLGQLTEKTQEDLLREGQLGAISLRELKHVLSKLGLQLRQD